MTRLLLIDPPRQLAKALGSSPLLEEATIDVASDNPDPQRAVCRCAGQCARGGRCENGVSALSEANI